MNAISINILENYFVNINKVILKFILRANDQEEAYNIEENTKL